MDIPSSRKREFHKKEINFIHEAILLSRLNEITLDWEPHRVSFNNVVEIHPVLFDCRGQLDTPCWLVRRTTECTRACACGQLVREEATGTYGSLRTAVAAALAETVRTRILENLADCSEPILKERPEREPPLARNDFITHCMHS